MNTKDNASFMRRMYFSVLRKPKPWKKIIVWTAILALISVAFNSFIASLIKPPPAVAEVTGTPSSTMPVTNGRVLAITTAPDGTIYLGGEFTRVYEHTGLGAPVNTTTGAAVSTFPAVAGGPLEPAAPGSTYFAPYTGMILAAVPDGSGGWYIGGDFTQVGGVTRNGIAHINSDGTLDSAFNPNANYRVRALVLSGSTLYVGGDFTAIGGQSRNRIAALNTSDGLATSWNPNATFGVDVNAKVFTLLLDGTTLYAGGNFTAIGGQSRNNIAALNTSDGLATSWNPNASSTVFALTLSGTTLYAGGDFSAIGGQSRNRIAALNTSDGLATSWNPNADSWVYSLALSGTTLYTGGQFTTIGRPIPQ
ncbi:MAG: hypothetical protein UX98_C0026G0003 [Parcubacteria group bacterium GW2011_GWA2_47_26]|nr:MAG: hypothetical protein UX98_C0026G0003 [Parcubacteria group bacterium GW2011_GWA2_47_26]